MPLKKLTHNDVIKFAGLFSEIDATDGVCSGYIDMWIRAAFSQDLDALYSRLIYLERFNRTDKQRLLFWIKVSHWKVRLKAPLSEEDILHFEIPAFFQALLCRQAPEQCLRLLNSEVEHQRTEHLDSFFNPVLLDGFKLNTTRSHYWAMNKNQLLNYLNDLQNLLKQYVYFYEIMLKIVNHNHAVGVKLDQVGKNTYLWNYVDVNDFQRYPNHPYYFRLLNSEELVSALFQSFTAPRYLYFLKKLDMKSIKKYKNNYILVKNSLYFIDRDLKKNTLIIFKKDQFFKLLHELKQSQKMTASKHIELCPDSLYNLIQKNTGHRVPQDPNPYLLCDVQFYTLNHSVEMNLKLEQFIKRYPIHKEQALLEDSASIGLMYLACVKGDLECIKELYQYNPEFFNSNIHYAEDLVLIALYYNHLHVLKYFREQAVKFIHFKTAEVLYNASVLGNLSIIKYFYKQVSLNDFTKPLQLPIIAAAWNGHFHAVRYLLSHHGHLNVRGNEGESLVWIAACIGDLEMLKYLISRGCTLSTMNQYGVRDIVAAAKHHHWHVVYYMLKKGCSPNSPFDSGSLLHEAVYDRKLSVVQRLVEAGADLNAVNKENKTVLDVAGEMQLKDISFYLYHASQRIKLTAFSWNTPQGFFNRKLKNNQWFGNRTVFNYPN